MRFRQIDPSNLDDHSRLSADDKCFYLHEYTSGQGYGFGEANNLISNLKKSVEKRGRAEYRYKDSAINQCSKLLGGAFNHDWLDTGTIVPVPPSKAKSDPLYDDRLLKICKGIPHTGHIDIRELVYQSSSIRAAHENLNNRPSVDELVSIYEIDESIALPAPKSIVVLDDVLTAGTHYRAVSTVLARRYPSVSIVGMFIARRVFPTSNAADDFDDL